MPRRSTSAPSASKKGGESIDSVAAAHVAPATVRARLLAAARPSPSARMRRRLGGALHAEARAALRRCPRARALPSRPPAPSAQCRSA
eukprot:1892006-Pleurochrysis_carterae.AAC.2